MTPIPNDQVASNTIKIIEQIFLIVVFWIPGLVLIQQSISILNSPKATDGDIILILLIESAWSVVWLLFAISAIFSQFSALRKNQKNLHKTFTYLGILLWTGPFVIWFGMLLYVLSKLLKF